MYDALRVGKGNMVADPLLLRAISASMPVTPSARYSPELLI